MGVFNRKCRSNARLTGKTAVVTGCNTGIGKPTVADFVRRGCRVIMACRNLVKAEEAAEDIRKETSGVEGVGVIVVVRLDLASFASVRECAAHLLQTEPQINILVNNAGLAYHPHALTEDGYEMHFASNHLGPFLFTLLLLPRILVSTPARIVVVSSLLHRTDLDFNDINMEHSFNHLEGYQRSKLSNILFASELSRRLAGSGVTTYSLHPGVVNTDVIRHLNTCLFPGAEWFAMVALKVIGKTPKQGAQTTIYCAVDEALAHESGFYYTECKKSRPFSNARDPVLALKLWQESLKMVGMEGQDVFVGCGTKI